MSRSAGHARDLVLPRRRHSFPRDLPHSRARRGLHAAASLSSIGPSQAVMTISGRSRSLPRAGWAGHRRKRRGSYGHWSTRPPIVRDDLAAAAHDTVGREDHAGNAAHRLAQLRARSVGAVSRPGSEGCAADRRCTPKRSSTTIASCAGTPRSGARPSGASPWNPSEVGAGSRREGGVRRERCVAGGRGTGHHALADGHRRLPRSRAGADAARHRAAVGSAPRNGALDACPHLHRSPRWRTVIARAVAIPLLVSAVISTRAPTSRRLGERGLRRTPWQHASGRSGRFRSGRDPGGLLPVGTVVFAR